MRLGWREWGAGAGADVGGAVDGARDTVESDGDTAETWTREEGPANYERKWKWRSRSHVRLFVTPWTVAFYAPLSMGILQARRLEGVAIPFSRGSSQPRARTQVSRLAGGFFPSEPPGESEGIDSLHALSDAEGLPGPFSWQIIHPQWAQVKSWSKLCADYVCPFRLVIFHLENYTKKM